MKSKTYFVKKLCELRNLDSESPEAQELYNLKIVELLILIKQNTPVSSKEEEPDEESKSLAELLGCT
jgi:hypothetical protein